MIKVLLLLSSWFKNQIIIYKNFNFCHRNIETSKIFARKNTPFVALDTLYKNGLMI